MCGLILESLIRECGTAFSLFLNFVISFGILMTFFMQKPYFTSLQPEVSRNTIRRTIVLWYYLSTLFELLKKPT
jgi:hypothetical protein